MSQEKYVERVLERFNMKNAKPVSTPLASHFFKLSRNSCSCTEEEKKAMEVIPYSSTVGSLMYVVVSTQPDIAHVVGTVIRFL